MVFDLLKALVFLPANIKYLRRSDYIVVFIPAIIIGIIGYFVFPNSNIHDKCDFIISAFVLIALCILVPLGDALSGVFAIKNRYGDSCLVSKNKIPNWPYNKEKRWYFRDWSVDTLDGKYLRIITLGPDIKRVLENNHNVDA